MIAPLKFTQDPVMRDDQPVHARWAVIIDDRSFGIWGNLKRTSKIRIYDSFDTREAAEDCAVTCDQMRYMVIAIAQIVYQDGDYIEDYDPGRAEKREEAMRKERESELLGAMDNGLNDVYRRAVQVVNGGWAQYRREVEPIAERARVEPGDGIKAALEAKKANRRSDSIEQGYRHINEMYRRSAAMRNGPSKRGQR